MTTAKRFEELECWKLSRELAFACYQMASTGKLSKDFGLRDQFRRAGVSVMNNIAEGFSRFSDKEFARFLEMSSSSCSEVKSMAYLMEDLGYLKESKAFHEKVDKTQAKILALVRYLKS
jgi:four helix bundle protein